MTGRIVRGVGGLYYVYDGERLHECKARGLFRKQKIKPMVGDMVEFSPEEGSFGYLQEILPRTSCLTRPPVSNIDLIIAVIAPSSPAPDLRMLDQLLVDAHWQGIQAAVCVNKSDLGDARALEDEYRLTGYDTFCVSAQSGEGIPQLRERLQGHVSSLAGQSGVGKSSLVNVLLPGTDMEVGEVSRIERGRHTTRHSELILLPEGGFLADTPGFSLLEGGLRDPAQLQEHFIEFAPYGDQCRFIGCQHLKEPGCAVQEAAENGEISSGRLGRYGELYQEYKERWSRRYD